MALLDDELAALCHAARAQEDPGEEDRRAVQAKLYAQLGAASLVAAGFSVAAKHTGASGPALSSVLPSAGSATTTAVAKGWALSSTAAWLVGGGTTSVVAALAIQLALPADVGTPTSSARPTTAPTQLAAAAAPQPSVPVPSSSVAAPALHSAPPKVVVPTEPRPASPPRRRSPAASMLRQEASALARVQRALRDGRSSDALALLDAQDQQYGHGLLSAERLAARVLASCDARKPNARALALKFLRLHPSSPLAARVRRSCPISTLPSKAPR